MMRNSSCCRRQLRPYYNLPSKSDHGRKMTGFLTPYRHWMWKQNELWRNVHEAQFEHLRRVYKRQWFESFRVNADEYIYKYNITKAAQLAQWEHEMQAQEKKRLETRQLADGRQALRQKHLDLLREFHERQFLFWYERASERLQSMNRIQYISPAQVQEHIERELDKYVAGSEAAYPLNFAGQMPLLEDREGNVAEVPDSLVINHATEHPDSTVRRHTPHEGTTAADAEERLLRLLVSAREESLDLQEDDSRALSQTIDDISREEEEREAGVRVAKSMEETETEREVSRRSYIDRGKTGSRAIFRRPPTAGTSSSGGDDASPASSSSSTPKDGSAEEESEEGADDEKMKKTRKEATSGSTPMRRRRKGRVDRVHALQQQQDALLMQLSARGLKPGIDTSELGGRGEVVTSRGRIRDKAAIPTQEVLMQTPELAAGSTPSARVHVQDTVDKRFKRGKYKEKKGDGDDGGEDL